MGDDKEREEHTDSRDNTGLCEDRRFFCWVSFLALQLHEASEFEELGESDNANNPDILDKGVVVAKEL